MWKETAHEWTKQNKIFRVNHYSWWEQELPSQEEMDNAWVNLEKHDYKVDYIVTHCCPNPVLFDYVMKRFDDLTVARSYDDHNVLTDFLDEVNEKATFSKWFFGHHHYDMMIYDKHIILYHQIVRIA